MLKDLMNNPIAWLILALVTIGSLVYAIYCQKANKERKEISYLLHSEQLILKERALFKEIKLICKEKELGNLCFSKIAIWNSGNKMLNGTDLAESQALSIEVAQGVELIDYHIFDITEKSNHISVELDGTQKLNVSFDYLNPNDGIALLIIHSGEKDDIGVGGIIKGGMPIKRLSYTNPFTQKTTKKKTPQKKMLERYCLALGIMNDSEAFLFPGKKSETHYSARSVDSWFAKILESCNIDQHEKQLGERGACLHCFRHVFVLKSMNQLEKAGHPVDMNDLLLPTYLGHECMIDTDKYMRFSGVQSSETIDSFESFTNGLIPEVEVNYEEE